MINGQSVTMDVDTCAEVTLVSSGVYEQLGRTTLFNAPRVSAYGGH